MTTAYKRVLVCGGRDYHDYVYIAKTLDQFRLLCDNRSLCIIQGGAAGADRLVLRWAITKGIPCITMEAAWLFYGNSAGAIRNQWMLDHCSPDVVVAFPGHTGTANMVSKAKLAGIPVYAV